MPPRLEVQVGRPMKITDVESFAISIPLSEPVAYATREVEERDHVITYVETDSGERGVGYSLGYGTADIIAKVVNDVLTPIVIDEDPRDTERLWREMFDGTVQVGRKGLVLRAISSLDIALWDMNAKIANQPLYKLLGAYTDSVPAYTTGGYYRDKKDIDDLQAEIQRYIDRGHDAVKIKVGGAELERDIERVQAVRETIGENRKLMLDANGKWDSKREAVAACRAFEEYDPYFIEEPVMPDSVELMSKVNDEISYPTAAGELEFSRYGFAELLREEAIDFVQADATVVGGITEWLRVANAAAVKDIPLSPHYNWNLHAHLVAASENGQWVEYFYEDEDVKVFDSIVEEPLRPVDGRIELPDRPGHGVTFDQDKLDKYRVTS